MKDQQESKVVSSGEVAVWNAEVHGHIDARELGRRSEGPYQAVVGGVGVDSCTIRRREKPTCSPVSEWALPTPERVIGNRTREDVRYRSCFS